MPFEDLLVPPRPKCKTCSFIDSLEPGLAEEVRVAVAKPKYSDKALAAGMLLIEGVDPPSESAIRTHRQRGHAR